MINAKTAHFIEANRLCDPLRLALSKAPEGVCLRQAVEQIAGWQRARKKLPTWAATEGVAFPPHLNIEQCSSESAARYKREIVERLMESENVGLETYAPSHAASAIVGRNAYAPSQSPMKRGKMVDLTAGYGVDFTLLSGLFERADYVERDAGLCELARHNLPLLGVENASVVCGSAEEYLETLAEPVDLIFIDPARRDDCGRRTYAIGDCRPDVLTLLPQIMAKTRHFIVKLSPMLDHREAVRQLGAAVSEVHLVATGGEMRETLVVMSGNAESGRASTAEQGTQGNGGGAKDKENDGEVPVTCWADGITFRAALGDSSLPCPLYGGKAETMVGRWLMLPNAAVMKSGCFATLCSRYGLVAADRDTHIFLSEKADFNGADGSLPPFRAYRVTAVGSMNRRDLRRVLEGVDRADVSVRNFPLSAEQLRARLRGVTRLGDGGPTHIFGLTVSGQRVVAVTQGESGTPLPQLTATI